MKINFFMWAIAFFLQCEIANMANTCPDTMVKTSCPRCVEYCDSDDATTQPNCDIARGDRFPCSSSGGRLRFCSCPEDWKWFNGSCVKTCPEEECTNDGLVYHKCFNSEWQLCPLYLKSKGNASRTHDCYPGCFCREGYFNIDGRCLPKPYCEIEPGKCGPGMVYRTSANICRRRCPIVFDLNVCPSVAYKGCFCIQGTYFSDYLNACVEAKQC